MFKKSAIGIILFSLFISFLFQTASYAQNGDSYFPYMGRIKGDNINIRAAATVGSEVMGKLKKGQDIIIIGEEGNWCKIKPPKDATAWVYADLVKDGIITKDNVNIRAGASLSSSVLGKLNEGDYVHIIKKYEDWYQIEIPEGMGYYVHRKFVKYLCPLDDYDYYIEKEKKTKEMFKKAEEFRRKELRKRYFEVNYDLIIQKYQEIIDYNPDSTEAEKALQRIADAKEKKKIAKTRIKRRRLNLKILKEFDKAEKARREIIYSKEFNPYEYDKVIEMYQNIINKYPDSRAAKESLKKVSQLRKIKEQKMSEWEKKKTFNLTGILKKGTAQSTSKANFKIIDSYGNIKGYVFSDAVDLRAYENKKVLIIGIKYTMENLGSQLIPVIKIKKIKLSD